MQLSREDFDWAVSKALLSADQSDALWTAFEARIQDRPGFNLIHLVYYLGALIVISAMTWFMTEAWDRYADSGILFTALVYACFFVLAGRYFWHKPGLKIPGGLLFTLAVFMTPLIIYGLERLTGFWPQSEPGITQWFMPEVRSYRYPFEIGSIIIGLIALKFVRFPFLTVPIMIALWGLTLDVTSFMLGYPQLPELEIQWTAFWFGIAMVGMAYLIDQRTKEDYAFWAYLGGLWAFWLGLTAMESDTEIGKFIYCMINVGLMFLSILLARRAFFVFGAIGVMVYVAHLASLFADSLLFPIALTLLGIGVIFLGVQYQRHRDAIERSIVGMLPDRLRRHLPRERIREF